MTGERDKDSDEIINRRPLSSGNIKRRIVNPNANLNLDTGLDGTTLYGGDYGDIAGKGNKSDAIVNSSMNNSAARLLLFRSIRFMFLGLPG